MFLLPQRAATPLYLHISKPVVRVTINSQQNKQKQIRSFTPRFMQSISKDTLAIPLKKRDGFRMTCTFSLLLYSVHQSPPITEGGIDGCDHGRSDQMDLSNLQAVWAFMRLQIEPNYRHSQTTENVQLVCLPWMCFNHSIPFSLSLIILMLTSSLSCPWTSLLGSFIINLSAPHTFHALTSCIQKWLNE